MDRELDHRPSLHPSYVLQHYGSAPRSRSARTQAPGAHLGLLSSLGPRDGFLRAPPRLHHQHRQAKGTRKIPYLAFLRHTNNDETFLFGLNIRKDHQNLTQGHFKRPLRSESPPTPQTHSPRASSHRATLPTSVTRTPPLRPRPWLTALYS
ncbi:hypothetical protein LXA43DRAFT_1094681 [Ganoderma leucocontextum]|nr:hypothetical protein LXA43DRAFT_1094681 [Ganoderma leucocontextum]